MENKKVKCRTCGNNYEIRGDCSTDQSVCPPCRHKERCPQDKHEPLDYSRLKSKFKVRAAK